MVAPAVAKVEGDTIVIGSSLSLTGKYSTNGFHTKKGYDFAVKRINDTGVKVAERATSYVATMSQLHLERPSSLKGSSNRTAWNLCLVHTAPR